MAIEATTPNANIPAREAPPPATRVANPIFDKPALFNHWSSTEDDLVAIIVVLMVVTGSVLLPGVSPLPLPLLPEMMHWVTAITITTAAAGFHCLITYFEQLFGVPK